MNKLEELRNKFNELIDNIIEISDEKDILLKFKEDLSDEKLEEIVSTFCTQLDEDNKKFKMLLERRSRLFNKKINCILIDEIELNTYLEDETSYLWECVQLLYAIYRAGNENNLINLKVNKVIETIEKFSLGEKPNFKPKNTDNECDELVMDLADTLRNNIVDSSKDKKQVNPMETMFKTAENISKKYANKIQSGKISMNDMFDSLGRMMSDIQQKTSEDEELKNINVDNLKDPSQMMKDMGIDADKFNPQDMFKNLNLDGKSKGGFNPQDMLKNLNLDGKSSSGFNPMEMVGSLLGNPKNKEKLTEEQLKEMEEFYSKFDSKELDNKSNIESKFKEFNEKLKSNMTEDEKNKFDEFKNNNNVSSL